MKLAYPLLALLFLSVFMLPAHAETVTQTRYFLYTTDSIHALSSAYKKLWVAPMGVLGTSISKTYPDPDGGLTFYTGVRVYQCNANGTQTQLTTAVSAIASIVFTGDFESISAVWNCPETTFALNDNIVVKAYVSINNSTWTQITTTAQWNTESLITQKLIASTWAFYYYVFYDWDGYSTATYFFAMLTNYYWLLPEIQPRLENMQFERYTTTTITESEFPVGLGAGALLMGFVAVIAFSIKKRR